MSADVELRVNPTATYSAGYASGLRVGREQGREQGYRDAVRWMSRLTADMNARQTFLLFKALQQLQDAETWEWAHDSAEYELQAGLREAYADPDEATD